MVLQDIKNLSALSQIFFHSSCDILDHWRQVTEVLRIWAPPELLPSSSKQQILLQLLQTLLNKVRRVGNILSVTAVPRLENVPNDEDRKFYCCRKSTKQ